MKEMSNISLVQFFTIDGEVCTHFTTTVHGGVSDGNYSSLNLAYHTGDDKDKVDENRERLAKVLNVSLDRLFVPNQTHSENVLVVDNKFMALTADEKKQKLDDVDALITNLPNICIAIGTADCVPILLVDTVQKVLGVVHAGWKGSSFRLLTTTVKKMFELFGCKPTSIQAGIGASICQSCFEVGDEVGHVFEKAGFDMNKIAYRSAETAKLHIDLKEVNRIQLLELGIPPQNIEVSGDCTKTNAKDFFSARRQTIHSGRMLTGGVLR